MTATTKKLLLSSLLIGILATSCGVKEQVGEANNTAKNAVATLDKGINALQSESTNWRGVLEETRDKLVDEAQSTLRHEINNLIQNGIAATGTEVRCNSDFFRRRMRQELILIRNKFAQKIGVETLPEQALEPGLCQVVPSSIDLSLPPDRRNTISLTGYDLDKSSITVKILNGRQEAEATPALAQTTKYLLTLNLSPTNGIQFSEKSNKILITAAGTDIIISEINIIQPSDLSAKHTGKDVLRTGVDNNNMTRCPYNSMIIGISGGRGHSSAFNEPHDIHCAQLIVPSIGASAKVSGVSIRETLVDSRAMTTCPPNSVVTGLTGGFGHSSAYNTSHPFLCQQVEQGFKVGSSYTTDTLIDNDTMTNCKDGYAVTGITGGYGHSSDYNEPHTIQCSEILKEKNDL